MNTSQNEMIGEIRLEHLIFYAHHGVSDAEQDLGNRYVVHVQAGVDLRAASVSDTITHTVNYAQMYQVVSRRMNHRQRLLEYLAVHIAQDLLDNFLPLTYVSVQVYKSNPPLPGLCEQAGISYTARRQHTD